MSLRAAPATLNRVATDRTPASTVKTSSAELLKSLSQLRGQALPLGRPADRFETGGCWTPRPRLPSDWQPLDVGAMVELNKLNQTKGPISGEQMADTIKRATEDLDGHAASTEWRTVSEWARNNAERLSPEARKMVDIYAKYAALSQARGESGIPQADYQKMLGEMRDACGDASAKKALSDLDHKTHGGTVSGQDLARAIQRGTADNDGQAAGTELKEFEAWAKKNEGRLSPEAREVLDVYRKHAKQAQSEGRTGLTDAETKAMYRELHKVGSGDVSARKALEKLDQEQGPISGEDLTQAIREGISDTDGHSTTSELKAFEQWAKKNAGRLTPEAEQVLHTYRCYARDAGKDGLEPDQLKEMFATMKQFQTFHDSSMRDALEGLDGKKGTISAKDLTAAIEKGAGDHDGQAAGVEYSDFMKWARQNYTRLSPDARKVVDLYEKHALKSLGKGETGIPDADFKKMLREMRDVGQPPRRPVFIAA